MSSHDVPGHDDHHEARRFLHREARALDEHRLHDWLDRVTEDVDYRVPIRVTRERGSSLPQFSAESYHLKEDYLSLEARVQRFDSDLAWSEDPPSRTRRFVSNVFVEDLDGDELSVRNNLLVFYAKDDSPDLLSAERFDTLRRVDGELHLAAREVRLDYTAMPVSDLSILL